MVLSASPHSRMLTVSLSACLDTSWTSSCDRTKHELKARSKSHAKLLHAHPWKSARLSDCSNHALALSISHAVHACSHTNRLALSSWAETYRTLNLTSSVVWAWYPVPERSCRLYCQRLSRILQTAGHLQYGQFLAFYPPPQSMAACGMRLVDRA